MTYSNGLGMNKFAHSTDIKYSDDREASPDEGQNLFAYQTTDKS
jgi:hypothetical protein